MVSARRVVIGLILVACIGLGLFNMKFMAIHRRALNHASPSVTSPHGSHLRAAEQLGGVGVQATAAPEAHAAAATAAAATAAVAVVSTATVTQAPQAPAAKLAAPAPAGTASRAAAKLAGEARRATGVHEKLKPLAVGADIYADPPLYPIPGLVAGVAVVEGPGGDYPSTVPLTDLVGNWAPDDPVPPETVYDTLRHFDWSSPAERALALTYRQAELPFVIDNVPAVQDVVDKWTWQYMHEHLGDENQFRTEVSDSNHLMYWKGKNGPPGWAPPSSNEKWGFKEWLQFAQRMPRSLLQAHEKHAYFRLDYKQARS